MKIFYLCSDLGIPILGHKGASVHVRSMVEAFLKAGHKAVVVTPVLTSSPWEKKASFEGEIIHIPTSEIIKEVTYNLTAFNATLEISNSLSSEIRRILYNQVLLREILHEFKDEEDYPDFIYERASNYSVAGVLLAKAFKRPIVLELNAPLALEQTIYRTTLLPDLLAKTEKFVLRAADIIVTVSLPLRDYVISLGNSPSKVHVLANGVDPNLFKVAPVNTSLKKQLGLSHSLTLGFVGGLRPWHGVEILPQLVKRLIKNYPQLKLLVLGEGPLKSNLQSDFKKNKLEDKVVFIQNIPHEKVPDLIRLMDVALAPYRISEHPFYFSPLKLFEYMACGVSVVAPSLGQIAEVVTNGKTGLLYRVGNLNELELACRTLLDNPSLRKKLGQAASDLVSKHYTWNANADKVIKLVEKEGIK